MSDFIFSNNFYFHYMDYVLFTTLLLLALAIGLYFGYFKKSSGTTDEYLLGGRQMKPIPIAVSLVASQLSPLSIMTLPADIYFFGIHYMYIALNIVSLVALMWYLIIPIFYANNISNCYEYLELRFDKKTRQIITVFFLMTVYLIMPVLMLIPALAFSQVTGINIHLINAIACGICVFYTMLGGIRAVVWTDVLQAIIMLSSVIVVGILGVVKNGGVLETWQRSLEGGRLHTDFTLDLTTRATFWNCFFGGGFLWTAYIGFNQSSIQRLVSMPSLSKARQALFLFAVGFTIIMAFTCITGLVIFARYYKCDPFRAGLVDKTDKLLPFFVQDVLGNVIGMPGIFVSGVFAAGLSTISAYFNSVTGVIYFDYIRPFVKHTQQKATFIMRLMVLLSGIYCVLGGFVVEKHKSMLQVVLTIFGISHGPLIGAFTMGMLMPRAHGRAVFIAIIFSSLSMLYIIVSTQLNIKSGDLQYVPLPTSIEQCDAYNVTIKHDSNFDSTPIDWDNYKSTIIKIPENFSITNISFHWYAAVGTLFVWLLGAPLSYLLTPASDKKLNPKLLAPCVRGFVPKELQDVPLQCKHEEETFLG